MNHRSAASFLVLLLCALLLAQCGGGAPVLPTGVARGELSGRVLLGNPVTAATVTVWKVDATLTRVGVLATATTDEGGTFAVPMPAYSGPLVLVATSGTFVDVATGVSAPLDGAELSTAVVDYGSGAKVRGLQLTPVSSWAVTLAAHHARTFGVPARDALGTAFEHLDAHLGALDWRTIPPADLTVPGPATLGPEARAGLVLAGLAFRARLAAERAGATVGASASAATLSALLTLDARDGTFDGLGPSGPLQLLGAPLGPLALRLHLAQGIAGFLASARNRSTLAPNDALTFEAALASATDPYLFCRRKDVADCATPPTDVEPPVLTFVKPLEGGGAHRALAYEVRAVDPSGAVRLRFLAPPQLKDAAALLSPDGTEATLAGALDVSALPEGPLTLEAEAEDALGNVARRSVTVTVANRAPAVSVSAPSEGAVVKGTVLITATAESERGTITRLELVDAPPGVGPDALAPANALAVAWDTVQAREGATALTVRATDSNGAFTDATVTVVVDNVAFGVVAAQLSAGAPIPGATVTLLALDDATGLPVIGRVGGAVLGQGGPTAADGSLTFTLSGENFDGPVQLVANGPALTYVDPSDGATPISLPSSFALTTTLGRYRTGGVLTVPVTLWTTLADAAARAHAAGKHPAAPGPRPLTTALGVVDPLFSAHVARPVAWDVRAVLPAVLTAPPAQSLRDVVYAALPDLALNQLARTVSLESHVSPGQVVTAVSLTQQLIEDLSDGVFDGNSSGAALKTAGVPPYALDANTTRFRMATELDRFIRGPHNFSGLTRADLQNAHVLDNLAGDVSLLYPAASPPIPFDNQPPAVVFAVTFTAADGSTGNAPVSSARLVAGTLTVTADAADPSGLQSLSVRVGGANLQPAQGNTPTHFVGTWVTTGDGPLTLTAHAADLVGNSGTTDLQLTVDNTQPSVSIAAPGPGFYSAQLPIEATATDSGGVVSLSPIGLAGFLDHDADRARTFGAWAISSTVAEGVFPVRFKACDRVLNCVEVEAQPRIDRTPPTLSVLGVPPPSFTNAAALSLTYAASDGAGAGVGAVKLRSGAAVFDAVLTNGHWVFSAVSLPTSGAAPLQVWAEDLADAPNRGEGKGGVHELSHLVRVDRTPPAAMPSPYPSYQDERTLDFQRDAQGVPLVPVVYLSAQPQVALAPGMTIYKAGTRLFASDGNVPALHYAVPFDSAQDAPLDAVLQWETPHCPSCLVEVPLSPEPARSAPGMAFFRLDLSKEAMGGRTGNQQLKVVFRDAAGNVSTRSDPIVWTVVRPPVALTEEAGWMQAADPRSVFAYRVAANSYAALFGPNANFASHRAARVVRYVVRNPAPYEVAVDLELLASTQSIKETWTNRRTNLYLTGVGNLVVDGFTFQRFHTWDDHEPPQCTDITPVPPACTPEQLSLSNFPWHRRGSATQFECGVPSMLSAADTVYPTLQSTVGVAAYGQPLPGGNEPTPATPFLEPSTGGTRGAIVPAATATKPGEVVFYLEVALPTARAEPLVWQALPEDPVQQYQYPKGELFLRDSNGFSCATGVLNSRFHTWRWNRALTSATSNVNGVFLLKTGAPVVHTTSGPRWPQFGLGSLGSAVSFNRSFSH